MDIRKILICPECKNIVDESLNCGVCKQKYGFRHGVYKMISPKLSGEQEILWEVTDEMIDNQSSDESTAENDTLQREYDSYKNQETLEAQKQQRAYMESIINSMYGDVCDLATGRGGMLQMLLNSENKNFTITCTDLDSRILANTRKIKETDDERVFYIATDGRYLSVKDNSFDFVTSLAGFGNIPDAVKVAEEIYRILKPGGKLVFMGGYMEMSSKSIELAKSKGLERGLVEKYLIEDLKKAGFKNIESTIVSKAVWGENPFDLLPVAGDLHYYCILQAEKI